MTDDEFKAKLVERLREWSQLTPFDCTDDELIEFTRRRFGHQAIVLDIKLRDLWLEITKFFTWDSYYKREYLRYQHLYNTLLAENACYRRRNAALRGKLTEMRRERHVKGQNESSGH